MKKNNLYKNEFIESNRNKNFVNNNSKIFYSIVGTNQFKRKSVPNTSYQGFIPFNKISAGKNKENILSHAFYNFTTIIDKNLLLNKIDNNNKKGVIKVINKNKIELINVFELMFSIKSVNDNLIVLKKNDISKILKNYSNNEDNFMQLINHRFSERKNENIMINWENITFNWKYDYN